MTMIRIAAFAVAGLAVASAQAELIYGLTTRDQLVTFDSAAPGLLTSAHFISGMAASEQIINIDFRPATGELFAMGSFNNLYILNVNSAVATRVGTGFAPQLNGIEFGFDFNPTVDRIRVVSDLDQNLRLNPITGGGAAIDGTLAYAAGDPNANANPNVVGSAYTNNFGGATATTLYGIDSNLNVLVTQNPPNNGTLNTVGSLGFDTTGLVGFDISGPTGTAFASLHAQGGAVTRLYTINLATGAATDIGVIGGASDPTLLRDLTAFNVPAPGALMLGLAGLTLLRRKR